MLVRDTARVYWRRIQPYVVKVKLIDNFVSIYLDYVQIFVGIVNEVTKDSGKAGIRYHDNAGGDIDYIAICEGKANEEINTVQFEPTQIRSEELVVMMDDKFPRVLSY